MPKRRFSRATASRRSSSEPGKRVRDRLARGMSPSQNLFTGLEYRGDTVGCVSGTAKILGRHPPPEGFPKMPGRVGDTLSRRRYFASRTSAVVCTGVGEAFVETLTAKYVDEKMPGAPTPSRP